MASTTSCATCGSSTLGSAGSGFSAGPLSTKVCTTTPVRIPRAKSPSVAIARVSFTADHLAPSDREGEREELVDALRVAQADGVDVDRVRTRARAADVRERERRDR